MMEEGFTAYFCFLASSMLLGFLSGTTYTLKQRVPKMDLADCLTVSVDTSNIEYDVSIGPMGPDIDLTLPDPMPLNVAFDKDCITDLTTPVVNSSIVGASIGVALCFSLVLYKYLHKPNDSQAENTTDNYSRISMV